MCLIYFVGYFYFTANSVWLYKHIGAHSDNKCLLRYSVIKHNISTENYLHTSPFCCGVICMR